MVNIASEVLVLKKDTRDREKEKLGWLSWIVFLLLLVIVFIVFRLVIGFTVIAGDSMNPTLEEGNVIVTSNIFFNIERNDIIVYRDQDGFNVIKRVIGLPNDTIAIQDGAVIVNGKVLQETSIIGVPNDFQEVIVPRNSYFVIGDNRTPGESLDSRSENVGAIQQENILGEVMFTLFPF
ncbi:signal peptidase I [Ornithinibacillus bavariensis]|uniref:signal peptidase I n=1 Tax=Ornithinibacillus bavariensis TaxID=545502 RepID=UPI000ED390F8|nr:signal peptidase I [Ornithinibacillus sp.]